MWANDRRAATGRLPGPQGVAKFAEHTLQVSDSLLQEQAHVNAWSDAGPPHSRDVRDFPEGQAEPARSTDEG